MANPSKYPYVLMVLGLLGFVGLMALREQFHAITTRSVIAGLAFACIAVAIVTFLRLRQSR